MKGRLYLPVTTYKSTTESATLRPLTSGLIFEHCNSIAGKWICKGERSSIAL